MSSRAKSLPRAGVQESPRAASFMSDDCRVVVPQRQYSAGGRCQKKAGVDGIHCGIHAKHRALGRPLEYAAVTAGQGGRRRIGDDEGIA